MTISIEALNEIFSEAFGDEVNIHVNSKRDDVELWDSINHLNLIVELEDKLHVAFTKEEIEKIESVQALLDVLKDK